MTRRIGPAHDDDRHHPLEADQYAEAREAVARERSRIARELHDVVAHQVSMMTVQAGAAKTVARDDADAAIDAKGDVEHAGRQALGELRHLLGVLQPDTADGRDLGPQPGLADIATLADQLAHAGAEVSLDIGRVTGRRSAAVDLSVYRIVQESLTNVIKHAGTDPVVDNKVDVDDVGLTTDVTNSVASTARPDLPASGFGIAGMRERAALLGGTLTAERESPDRFHVHARIPLDEVQP